MGVAYLVGAVLDKLFDTVVGGAEQWLRLRVAIERHSKTGGPSAQSTPKTDPFDQGRLEAELRKAEGAVTWMNYLRTRIRLTRTLGVTAPLIGLAASTSILFAECRLTRVWGTVVQLPQGWCSWVLAVLPPLILGIAASFAQFSRLPKTHYWNYGCPSVTEGGASSTQSKHWKWKRGGLSFEARTQAPPSRSFSYWALLAWRPVFSVYVGAWMSGAIIACWSNRSFPFGMTMAGSAIGGLSLWAWHRILQSYMAFIANWLDIKLPLAEEPQPVLGGSTSADTL